MSDIPLATRIYTAILLAVTTAVVGWSALLGDRPQWDSSDWLTALILLLMIVLVEKFEIDFPHAAFQFSITVGAILALAAGLTLGPLAGALLVIIAELVSDVWERLKPIQIAVNAANLGLSTFLGAQTYEGIAQGAASPLSTPSAMAATILAAVVYTVANAGILALIIAPVVGDSPFNIWRTHFSATYMFVILPTLGSLVPVIAAENPFGILILFVPLVGSHLAQRALRKVEDETQATMEGLADALERRDPYTFRHSIRVTDHVQAILSELPHVPALTQRMIIDAARVHDLGKVGTQDSALRKPGPLTDEERREMQLHATIGAEIIGRLAIYKRGIAIVRHHHERWDGKGYPDGLAGEAIPLGARIIGVADAFDAMTSDRPYRAAMSVEAALAELHRHAGTQFDPQIVAAFARALARPAPVSETGSSGEPVMAPSAAD